MYTINKVQLGMLKCNKLFQVIIHHYFSDAEITALYI